MTHQCADCGADCDCAVRAFLPETHWNVGCLHVCSTPQNSFEQAQGAPEQASAATGEGTTPPRAATPLGEAS